MSEPNPDQNVGAYIQRRRGELNMSQGELATRVQALGLNWSQGTLSRVELGERPVRLTEARPLAEVLSVPPELLLTAMDNIVGTSDESLQNFLWMGLTHLQTMQLTLRAMGEALNQSQRHLADASARLSLITDYWKKSITSPVSPPPDALETIERFAQRSYASFDDETDAADVPAESAQGEGDPSVY